MNAEKTVTIKVHVDTKEAEAAIERLTAKLAKMADVLTEANPQHRELASDGIKASINIKV